MAKILRCLVAFVVVSSIGSTLEEREIYNCNGRAMLEVVSGYCSDGFYRKLLIRIIDGNRQVIYLLTTLRTIYLLRSITNITTHFMWFSHAKVFNDGSIKLNKTFSQQN